MLLLLDNNLIWCLHVSKMKGKIPWNKCGVHTVLKVKKKDFYFSLKVFNLNRQKKQKKDFILFSTRFFVSLSLDL